MLLQAKRVEKRLADKKMKMELHDSGGWRWVGGFIHGWRQCGAVLVGAQAQRAAGSGQPQSCTALVGAGQTISL